MRTASDQERREAQFHDVVIIGNGPSAITLSYLLAGNWPYYSGGGGGGLIPAFLHQKLETAPATSLLQHDLEHLSEGLEGRSNNPISVLFDTLNHPGADLGSGEQSTVTWVKREEKAVDHVVLGRGPPGGVWQKMAGDLLTVSLGSWMELPGLGFQQWCVDNQRSRARVADVARYYADYVQTMRLTSHFRDSYLVTSLRRYGSNPEDDRLTLVPGSGQPISQRPAPDAQPLWLVEGYRAGADDLLERFCFASRRVALACGTSDVPSRLGCLGEALPFVCHTLSSMEALLASGRVAGPLLVVGAGLSAADVILAARARRLPVIHAFRRRATDRALIFYSLPRALYPEYHEVHQMMRDGGRSCSRYRALPQARVTRIGESGAVTLATPEGAVTVNVSHVAVMIGARPCLEFVAEPEALGSRSGEPIDGRHNPVQVDAFTHEAVHAPGLYAMGPLVGDNFVRFVQGGALAIAAHVCGQRAAELAPAEGAAARGASELSP
ncbi:oxidative stress-induced growth inhibitor 1-like [Pollicipes pollicipes]|uniref:oxidative stress-induced growth inhibitor 1-like n=1 Tax=Pollicipes pollicipes TaxID=41117 RepID=UPI0018859A85|nr:oxidative stress-induced growth inhibitor 1-like [Pollicipes pollicipes]XP_037085441.1 oxidative stress-induced growth inhibitor 1-like [Pollicipes pollicipes]